MPVGLTDAPKESVTLPSEAVAKLVTAVVLASAIVASSPIDMVSVS